MACPRRRTGWAPPMDGGGAPVGKAEQARKEGCWRDRAGLRLGLLAAGSVAVLVGGAIAVGLAIANREEPSCAACAGAADCQYSGCPGGPDRCGLRPPRFCGRRDERAAGVLLAIGGYQYPALVGLSGHRAERGSDGRARSYRRGVSGGHRGTGAGLRESNGEDPSRMPQGRPRRQPVRAGLATL